MNALYTDPVANPVFYPKIVQGLRAKGHYGKLGLDHVKTVFSLDFVQQFEKYSGRYLEIC